MAEQSKCWPFESGKLLEGYGVFAGTTGLGSGKGSPCLYSARVSGRGPAGEMATSDRMPLRLFVSGYMGFEICDVECMNEQ